MRRLLPVDLDGLARETGLLTRLRGVASAEDLTRLLLLSAVPKSSLRVVARWANETGLASLCWSGLFHRFRRSEAFLKACFEETLRHAVETSEGSFQGYNLVAVDATALCGPGAKGTDQRLHTVYDLGRGVPRSVEITGMRGGEHLSLHSSFGPGDLVLADRGYGHASNLTACLKSGARFLIRFEFASFKLLDAATLETISIADSQARLPEGAEVEMAVKIPNLSPTLRVLGTRNPEGKAVWLITDLSQEELPLSQARALYAARWQVELFFKRMKSILDLDELPTRDGPTARPWIWAKLTLVALAVCLGHESFSPWEEDKVPLAAVHPRDVSTPACPAPGRKQTKTNPKANQTKTKATRILET